ncbi:MAG: hypothetical protein CL781_02955 [Chloroflexi bacterium]|nr:hypothetical protein [Chloroflexota bacterium]|tara:strand:- start:33 stop:1088 length:1056 start_codon:yes stop_codon:yes gene_type:complete
MALESKLPKGFLRVGFPYEKTLGMRRLTNTPVQVLESENSGIRVLCRGEGPSFIRNLSGDDDDMGGINLINGINNVADGYDVDADFVWPSSIAYDPDGNISIADEGNSTITTITLKGEIVDRWGEEGNDFGQLNRPSSIIYGLDGLLYVSDTYNHRIQVFEHDGKFVKSFGQMGQGDNDLNNPWGLFVDAYGSIYVADWGNNRLQKFDAEGNLILSFGGSGNGDGEFNHPSGVTVDSDGDIYVTDWGNNRVQLFNASGMFVEEFRGDSILSRQAKDYMITNLVAMRLREMTPIEPQKRLRWPMTSTVGSDGRLYVADYGSHRIQVYKKDIVSLGENEIGDFMRSPTLYTQF